MFKNGPVFKFSISDLDKVFGRSKSEQNKKAQEVKLLKDKFREWELSEAATVELTPDVLAAIITDPDSTQTLVEWAEKLGTILKSLQLTTSQIRNIFGTVRQIEMGWTRKDTEDERRDALRRLLLLKPRLAYQSKRAEAVEELEKVLSAAIDNVSSSRENFQRFVDFFEAVLAYHTAAGGK
jgi:CRISPR-associated protein Csm2